MFVCVMPLTSSTRVWLYMGTSWWHLQKVLPALNDRRRRTRGLDMLPPPSLEHAIAAMAIMIIIVLQQCRASERRPPSVTRAPAVKIRTLTNRRASAFLPFGMAVNARNEPNDCNWTGRAVRRRKRWAWKNAENTLKSGYLGGVNVK